MFMKFSTACAVAAVALSAGAVSAQTPTHGCDRACLTAIGGTVLDSMVRHDPGALPLSARYAATENNVPQAVSMMNLWRTVTGVKSRYFVVDAAARQIFVVATVSEGPTDSLMFGRLGVDADAQLSEVELYIDRSRGDAGFQYGLRKPGMMAFPKAGWLGPIPAGKRASRAELEAAGRSIFDGTITSPPIAAGCVMMENGQISNENPEVLKYLMPSDVDVSKIKKDADGQALVPCAAPPERPSDKRARMTVIDEENGIVVSTAMISGVDHPYLVENPTTSAFVPFGIMQPYLDALKAQDKTGTFTAPRVKGWPVTASVTELYRVFDGKIQAMLLLFNMEPYGAKSPWVEGGK